MKHFYTFAIVLAGSMLLASCGGGSGESPDKATTAENESGESEDTRMKVLAVPGAWVGRLPPKITNTPTSQAIPSPQGPIAANLLLLEIKLGQDVAAVSFISSKRWTVVGRNDEVIKVAVSGGTYQTLLQNKSVAEASGYFSLVEFIGYVTEKPFTNPDPSLNDTAFWNYDAIDARQSWAALGGVAELSMATVSVLDSGFSQSVQDDLRLSNIYNGVGTICNSPPASNQSQCNHGYHVSGIIAATGNDGVGHVGIASGYTNRVAVRGAVVSADDGLMVSLRDEVLTYTGALKASVVNMSQGNPISSDVSSLDEDEFTELVEGARRSSRIIRSTIERRMAARSGAGLSNEVLFVQASGNEGRVKLPDGSNLSSEYSYLFASFLAYQTGSSWYTFVRDRTLLVGAFDSNRSLASFTSLPSTDTLKARFILAPGVGILSNTRYGVAAMSGTSMATPHVAAVAASIAQVGGGGLTAKEIADIILSTADNQAGTEWKLGSGFKYLNAERAVKEAIRRKNEANCGTISAPATVPVPLLSVTAGVPYTYSVTTTTAPKNNKKFSSYLWTSSEGFNNTVFVSPDIQIKLNTPTTPPSVATVTVIPVLDDGTVCTGATQITQVSVVPSITNPTDYSLFIEMTPAGLSSIGASFSSGVTARYLTPNESGLGAPAVSLVGPWYGGYLNIPNRSELIFAGGATIDMYARVDDTSGSWFSGLLFSKGYRYFGSPPPQGFAGELQRSGYFSLTSVDWGSCQYSDVDSYAPGRWIRYTFSISTSSVSIYRNGVLRASCPMAVGYTIANTSDLRLGGNGNQLSFPSISLGRVKIFKRALSSSEIAILN